VTRSHWIADALSWQQVLYAALDVYVCGAIFRKLVLQGGGTAA